MALKWIFLLKLFIIDKLHKVWDLSPWFCDTIYVKPCYFLSSRGECWSWQRIKQKLRSKKLEKRRLFLLSSRHWQIGWPFQSCVELKIQFQGTAGAAGVRERGGGKSVEEFFTHLCRQSRRYKEESVLSLDLKWTQKNMYLSLGYSVSQTMALPSVSPQRFILLIFYWLYVNLS